jgi:hypothetical protein
LFRPAKFSTLRGVDRSALRPSAAHLVTLAVAGLLALHLVLAFGSTLQRAVTVDEIFHVSGGYFFNKFGDYRIHPENGVLPQRLHGLPASLAGAKPPELTDNIFWRTSDLHVVSHQFFFRSGNDHWPLLLGARALNLLFSLALGLLVFAWARHLAGDLAGLVALGLTALSPTLLAHGPLATTDVVAALLLTASAGAFWLQLRSGGWPRLLLSAAIFSLTCVSKFSAVLLLPVFVLLAFVHLAATPRGERRFGPLTLNLALHGAAAVLVIWAAYGFRHSAFAPGVPRGDHLIVTWEWIEERAGWQGNVVRWLNTHRLLPESFLFGYLHTYVSSLSRAAFLAGDYSVTGWRAFFPLAFWWKSTPVELAAAGLCVVSAALRWRLLGSWLWRLTPLVVLGAVYGGAALASRLNIGHRHLLPLYPALFIAAGLAVAHLRVAPRMRRTVAAAAVALQLASAAAVFPHYLAYFNLFAGGPANGHRLLVDSSLDWGQDLARVKPWLDAHNPGPNPQPVFLFYFGSGEPAYYGIQARQMPFAGGLKATLPFARFEGGIYVVSATNLANVYSPYSGPWTSQWENEYQELRALEPVFEEYIRNPERRARLERDLPAERWQRGMERYDGLRFARLCHYLRVRGPDAMLGYSILIYRLGAPEVAAATGGSLAAWHRLLEQTAARPR